MKITRARLESAARHVLDAALPVVRSLFGTRAGLTLFLFTYGEQGSLAYISTAERDTMIATIEEWLSFQKAGLTTDPQGERGKA